MNTSLAQTEERMREIARLNAEVAIDQMHEYRSESEARAAYLINALDTMAEEGIRAPRTAMVLFFDQAFEKAKADAALSDFNYVGSRHHY